MRKYLSLFVIALFCLNFTPGTYDISTSKSIPSPFPLKEGQANISGDILISEQEEDKKGNIKEVEKAIHADKVSFYDPNDEKCRSGGDPVGRTTLKTLQAGNNIVRTIDLSDIQKIEVIDEIVPGSEVGKVGRYAKVKITFATTTKSKKTEDERLINENIIIGFHDIDTGENATSKFSEILAIENISGAKKKK